MQILISLVVITATRVHSILSSMEHNINYWIELELQAVHWKPTCLTTGGCVNPRFRISKSNKFNAEIIARHSRKFITHWVRGKPHEITLQCEVIGMDPLYGFSRTCDTTQNIEIFKENDDIENLEEFGSYANLESENELPMDEKRGKLIVEIQAKCFNASFAARKYTKRCPWCFTQDDMTLIESAPEYESTNEDGTAKMGLIEKFEQFFFGEQTLLIFLLSLSLMSLLGLICLLLIISKQRHFISLLQKRSQPINHLNSYFYSEQLAKPSKSADDRYDVPWDRKCILQRFWINENPHIDDENATMIGSKLLNRTSVPTLTSLAHIPRRTTITGTISTMSKRFSPNSSLCEHHEDSGLDSV
uniref:ZP domain-containing protein n=1 Tax=Elaeophora elaphi TaxID=1147741 RepID=A0A0R3RH73_9BILA